MQLEKLRQRGVNLKLQNRNKVTLVAYTYVGIRECGVCNIMLDIAFLLDIQPISDTINPIAIN